MRNLSPAARRYLIHTGLLTFGLAISALFFNLLLLELGYDQRSMALPILGELPLLGLLNSAPVLLAAVCSLPLWWLVSRIGPQPGLVLGALLHAGSLTIVALWPAPLTLLAGIALAGPATVLYQVSAAPFMMRHSSDQERALLFSISAGLNIGLAGLGSLIAGMLPAYLTTIFVLPTRSAAYRATFLTAAAIAVLAIFPLLSELKSAKQSAAVTTYDLTSRNKIEIRSVLHALLQALRFVISPLLVSFGAALLIPYLNLYFRQRYAASDQALGLVFALIGIATGAATLVAPLLSRRIGKPGSVVLTQALSIPCLLLLAFTPVLWVAATLALVRGSLMNMAIPLYDAHAMEHSPEPARPMVIGLIKGAFSVGYIVGPTLSAQIQRDYGFTPIFFATATFYALAALANYLLFLRPASLRAC